LAIRICLLYFDYDNWKDVIKGWYLEDLGLGKQEIYAGGWQVKGCGDEMFSEYLIIDNDGTNNNNNNNNNKAEDIIKELFKELFEVALNNCKFLVHNLGRFKAIFLILIKKILIKLGYEVVSLWKDNKVLQIKVYNPKTNNKKRKKKLIL